KATCNDSDAVPLALVFPRERSAGLEAPWAICWWPGTSRKAREMLGGSSHAHAIRLAPTLSNGRTAALLPGTHAIRCPFIEIARSYSCLYPGKPHIVSDSVAHARESNGDTSVP